jgi:hypothetical protein
MYFYTTQISNRYLDRNRVHWQVIFKSDPDKENSLMDRTNKNKSNYADPSIPIDRT